MKRHFLCIVNVLCLTGCASAGLIQSSETAYQEYLDACRNGQEEAAGRILMNNAFNPCPEEKVLQNAPENIAFDLMAKNGDETFLYEDGEWKWAANRLPRPNEVLTALGKLKYALKNNDAAGFRSLMDLAELSNFKDISPETMRHSDELNDLYASLAVTQDPWFQLENTHAVFEIPGWMLKFEWQGDAWRLVQMKRH